MKIELIDQISVISSSKCLKTFHTPTARYLFRPFSAFIVTCQSNRNKKWRRSNKDNNKNDNMNKLHFDRIRLRLRNQERLCSDHRTAFNIITTWITLYILWEHFHFFYFVLFFFSLFLSFSSSCFVTKALNVWTVNAIRIEINMHFWLEKSRFSVVVNGEARMKAKNKNKKNRREEKHCKRCLWAAMWMSVMKMKCKNK